MTRDTNLNRLPDNHAADRRRQRTLSRMAGTLAPPPAGSQSSSKPKSLSRRYAQITQVNGNTVTLLLGKTTIAGVPYLDSCAPGPGDTVALDFLGTKPLVIGVVNTAGESGKIVSQQAYGGTATASEAWSGQTWAGVSAFVLPQFTKKYAGTKLRFAFTESNYIGGNVGEVLYSFFYGGGPQVAMTHFYFNQLSTHTTVSWVSDFTGIPAGTILFEFAVLVVTPGTVWTIDGNDSLSGTITEVW